MQFSLHFFCSKLTNNILGVAEQRLIDLIFSCIPDTKEFHSPETDQPFLYCILSIPNDEV